MWAMLRSAIGISDEHEALRDAVRRWAENTRLLATTRAMADSDAEDLPSWWNELASQGWLGLHLPEADGGAGYGLLEAAVVVEELGRACAPGPALSTVIVSAVLDRFGGAPLRDLLAGMAAGTAQGGVGLGCDPVPVQRTGTGLTVSGSWSPVFAGGAATHLLLPVAMPEVTGGDVGWIVVAVDSAGLAVTPTPGVDRSRWPADVTARDLAVDGDVWFLAPAGAAGVEGVAGLLASAEAVGVADWCVATAAGYATEREQFGRPIGQFQAVKHRCADMLCRLEAARAATWTALQAVDRDEPGRDLAVAVAAGLAPDAAYQCAKDCIQVLGGIGFTWEHDAHLFLKRSIATRAVFGPPARWRAQTTRLARAGARHTPSIDLADEDGAAVIRRQVRSFLDDLRSHDRLEWNRRIADAGYLAPHWPAPWGRDASPLEQLVIDDEFRTARVRRPHLAVGAWALPTLIAHGTPEQQERFIPPTLRLELTWCQLFSEPGAGSDLASLRTRATRTDGGWLLTGQKVWTSLAQQAQWGICLARTDPAAPRHEGIGCFLVDMASPGIDIRPLREITGAEMFNEVFLDDVYVPDDFVVGGPTDGWRAARTTLGNERVSMGAGSSMGPGLEALLDLAAPHLDDPVVADAIGALIAEAASVRALGTRMTLRALAGSAPGPEASIRKLLGVEHDQRVQEVGLELLGPAGASDDPAAAVWVGGFLGNRSLSIAGGTSEIQRNVIAERLLDLPRD